MVWVVADGSNRGLYCVNKCGSPGCTIDAHSEFGIRQGEGSYAVFNNGGDRS